ncbi:methyltransferase domain-containing protein [Candidatus Mycalebacterium sp.]
MSLANFKKYDSKFYKKRGSEEFPYSANIILGIALKVLPHGKSVVDVGCGTGVWLRSLKENYKTEKIAGIDGEWIDRQYLNDSR